ncbi:hypothetical protein [Streptomyces sp. NPDC086777]|uniref:hypothetical protein n=1 Tax=Streptomyces sp. NPDC086777 TaxID=3154866 RepID=UPI00344C26CA
MPPRDVVTDGDDVAVGAESIPVPLPLTAAVGPELAGPGDADAHAHPRAQADPDRTAGADRHPAGAPHRVATTGTRAQ